MIRSCRLHHTFEETSNSNSVWSLVVRGGYYASRLFYSLVFYMLNYSNSESFIKYRLLTHPAVRKSIMFRHKWRTEDGLLMLCSCHALKYISSFLQKKLLIFSTVSFYHSALCSFLHSPRYLSSLSSLHWMTFIFSFTLKRCPFSSVLRLALLHASFGSHS